MPSDTTTTAPLLVDRREAARLLGVSPGTIDNLRLAGALPSVKIAARRLYDVADLRRYIEERKESQPTVPIPAGDPRHMAAWCDRYGDDRTAGGAA